MGVEGSRRDTLTVAALCVSWYAVSSASNVVGKVVLTEFPFPVTVSVVQLLSVWLLSAPALAMCGVQRVAFPTRYCVRVLLPLAGAKFLFTVCSQVSIWKVPVSYAHTVNATTPLWKAGLARALFGERLPRGAGPALLAIASGVALASATELSFNALGLGAALAAAVLLALQHLFAKRVLRELGVHPLCLLAWLSRAALAPMAVLWAWCDAGALWLATPTPSVGWPRLATLLAADRALAYLQATLAYGVLARVSPLDYAVASAAKHAAVVGASLLLLRNPAPPLNVCGMALAALGVLAYNHARVAARAASAPLPV